MITSEINFNTCPTKIKVGHYLFDIHFVETDEFNHYNKHGQASEESSIIMVRIGDGANTLNTIMHEITHTVHFYMDLHDECSEEDFTSRGTNGMMAFWYDNPHFARWFFSQLMLVTEEMHSAAGLTQLCEEAKACEASDNA